MDDMTCLLFTRISSDVCGVDLTIEDSSDDLIVSNPVRPRRSDDCARTGDCKPELSKRDLRSATKDDSVRGSTD
jgi:hypothetical protein